MDHPASPAAAATIALELRIGGGGPSCDCRGAFRRLVPPSPPFPTLPGAAGTGSGSPNSSTGVRAATYVHHGRSALIAVASFVPNATTATLTIDYAMLGLVPSKATLTAPKLLGPRAGQGHLTAPKLAPMQAT